MRDSVRSRAFVVSACDLLQQLGLLFYSSSSSMSRKLFSFDRTGLFGVASEGEMVSMTA